LVAWACVTHRGGGGVGSRGVGVGLGFGVGVGWWRCCGGDGVVGAGCGWRGGDVCVVGVLGVCVCVFVVVFFVVCVLQFADSHTLRFCLAVLVYCVGL